MKINLFILCYLTVVDCACQELVIELSLVRYDLIHLFHEDCTKFLYGEIIVWLCCRRFTSFIHWLQQIRPTIHCNSYCKALLTWARSIGMPKTINRRILFILYRWLLKVDVMARKKVWKLILNWWERHILYPIIVFYSLAAPMVDFSCFIPQVSIFIDAPMCFIYRLNWLIFIT